MRSGPLYRIGGSNRAVASLGSSSLILVGQDERLLLVDLNATHGREEMPIAGEMPLPQPVNTLSAAEDGSYVLVTLADDSVRKIDIAAFETVEPPVPEPEPAIAEEEVEQQAPPPSEPEPAAAEPEPPPVLVVQEPEVQPLPASESEPVVAEVSIEDPAPPHSVPEPAVVEPEPLPTPEPEPVAVEEAVAEQPPPSPEPVVAEEPIAAEPIAAEPEPLIVEEKVEARSPPPESEPPVVAEIFEAAPQVRGRIEGTGLEAVVAVLLLGPNNMLREAARIPPARDGSWSASGLQPGRYRVQLDGGGRRVLVTDPAFLLVDIEAEGTVQAAVIRLLKTL
jgi:hypothetical protein